MNQLPELPKVIGDSLGRGVARDLFRQVKQAESRLKSVRFPAVELRTLRQRKRTCQLFQAYYRPILIDAIAGSDYWSYSSLILRSGRTVDDQDLLLTYNEVWDFTTGRAGSAHGLMGQIYCDAGTISGMSLHAIQRCVQRARVRTVKDLIAVIGAASNWTAISNALLHDGPFMIPAEHGMLCCDTVMPLGPRHSTKVRGTLIKTFVGLDVMTEAMRARWERLCAATAQVDTPRCVRAWINTETYRPAFELMADEGRRWLEWRQNKDKVRGEA